MKKEVPQAFEWRRIAKPIHEPGDPEPPAQDSFLHLEEFERTSYIRPTYLLTWEDLGKGLRKSGSPRSPLSSQLS